MRGRSRVGWRFFLLSCPMPHAPWLVCDTNIAARISAPPTANERVNGSPYQRIDVTDAATGSNARITAASVALTRACPHISATNAIAVVTIAVVTITAMTSGVIGGRGTKIDGGTAKRPTASTCTAASPSAEWRVVKSEVKTTC